MTEELVRERGEKAKRKKLSGSRMCQECSTHFFFWPVLIIALSFARLRTSVKNPSWTITTFSMMFFLLMNCQEDGSDRQGADVIINESGEEGRAVCLPLTSVSWGAPCGDSSSSTLFNYELRCALTQSRRGLTER